MTNKDFLETRLVVDLIGPIIDVSSIPLFKELDCRFDSEEQIAEKLNSLSPVQIKGEQDHRYVKDDIFQIVSASLSRPSGIHLIESAVLDSLYFASKAGFSVSLASTAPDVEVFDSARKAVESFFNAYPLEYAGWSEKIEIHHINEKSSGEWQDKGACWRRHLEDGKNTYFTIVINDSSSEDLDITQGEKLFDEWIPGIIHQDDLSMRVRRIVEERKRRIDSLHELKVHKSVDFEEKSAVEGFFVWDKETRDAIDKKWKDAKALRLALDNSKPVCIFLGGPPGSGKSYFVEQCLSSLGEEYGGFPTMSLSGVAPLEYVDAIDRHIEDVYRRDKKSTVAFLDEVDTAIEGNTSFRYLMDPMTGNPTDARGRKIDGERFGAEQRLYWFFAGSAAGTRDGFVDAFFEADKKVRDFFDRIQVYIELPGVSTPGEAMLQAIVNLTKPENCKKVNSIEKSVLLAFGSTNWESARQLQTVCQLIASRVNAVSEQITLEFLKESVPDISDFSKVVETVDGNFGDETMVILHKPGAN